MSAGTSSILVISNYIIIRSSISMITSIIAITKMIIHIITYYYD